ncbi:hypothetical protein CsSME_00021020 [Camellia sinensis var. sinensis]
MCVFDVRSLFIGGLWDLQTISLNRLLRRLPHLLNCFMDPLRSWSSSLGENPMVHLVGETETKISLAISVYTLTRAGGADNLMGSLNAHVPPDDAPEDPHANAMPSIEQPQYRTEFLAMEEERHNQRVQ